jgi:phosphatidylglycerophosphate synthase
MVAADRRPIAARDHPLVQRIAARLIRSRVSPNAISVGGMVFGIGAGAAFALAWCRPDVAAFAWLLGALCVQLRLAANMFDGMVAVGRGAASPVGELYNEVPDRISDSAILLGVGVAACGDWALGATAALSAMLTAYVRAVGKAAGAPSDFGGPMAKQQRMFLVTLLALWCATAPDAWQSPALPAALLWVVIVGALITAGLRVRRIARALRYPR